MSATARLLQAASKIMGGDGALARHLGIQEVLLAKLVANPSTFPDALLLRVIDIVLDDRDGLPSTALPPNALRDSEAPPH